MLPIPKLIFAGILLADFALIGPSSAQAKQDPVKPEDQFVAGTPLSALDKQHFLNDTFTNIETVLELPESVQRQILGASEVERMANSRKPYQVESVIHEPLRRLILAGTSTGYCFVYARYGGFGSWPNLSLYRLSDKKAALMWRGYISGLDRTPTTISSLLQLRDAVSKGKFSNVYLSKQPEGSI